MNERFSIIPQSIPEVLLLHYQRFGDERGFFSETFRENEFAALGLPEFVQENHSRSVRGVLRGLHYQNDPKAIGKLVRCARGSIFDVAVDVRKDSPTFGKWVGVELNDQQPNMLYVPVGFAHGFCTLSEIADIIYKQTGYYSPEHEGSIRFNDPTIAIKWPVDKPMLSAKDAAAPVLAEANNQFIYRG
ncbi:MAG: dTDP-4-dehydrorhamnose 3,5-epimerase [Deltaproteobacteria bacterium]|nr:dTDP-4-dehydrorhamnose 3,5-epimerase [Deltaproteobacteria bacterium]